MKIIRAASSAAVLFLCGSVIPAYAQHEGGEKQAEKQSKPQEQHAQQPQRAQQPALPRPQEQPRAAQPKTQAEPRQARTQQTQPSAQPRAEHAQHAPPARQQEQHAAVQQHSQQQQARQQPQQQPRAQQTSQARQQPQRTQAQARSWQQQKGWAQQGGGSQGHATFAQDRSSNWSSDHRTWAQRGGYGGYYIPQAQFNVSFGSGHFFRLGGMPPMYMGYPQFSYGGFSFLMVDPWPGDWPGDWYSADDVYVDYDDGYYLYNRNYPQERLAITIRL